MSIRRRWRLRFEFVALFCLLVFLFGGCSPADPRTEVRRLQAAGNYAGSIELLRELLEENPNDGELNLLYGTALVRVGQPSVAIWPLRRAMEDPDLYLRAGLELAGSEMRSANFDEAVEIATKIIESAPESIEALLLRSSARAQTRRDYEGALADADRVLEIDPENLEALPARAYALLGLQRVDEAGEALETLGERYRDSDLSRRRNVRHCVATAVFAKEKGDFEAAEETFERCLEEFPSGQTLISEAVRFHDEQGRPERSLEILRTAHEAAPNDPTLRAALAQRLSGLGEAEEAERLFLDATKSEDPAVVIGAWGDLSNYYVRNGEFEKGVNAIEQVLAREPNPDQELLFRYADLLVGADRFERALEVTARIESDPRREVMLGRIEFERGNPADALVHFTTGLLQWPDNAVARYYAARAAERTGDVDRAIEEYRYSVRASAHATDARERLARIYMAEGQFEAAQATVGHESDDVTDSPEIEAIWFQIYGLSGGINPRNVAAFVSANRERVLPGRIAGIAVGATRRLGPGGAVDVIRAIPGIDLAAETNGAILEVMVFDLIASGRGDEARTLADAAYARAPKLVRNRLLRAVTREELTPDESRATYETVLAEQADDALALAGLARLAAARGETDAAIALYERAAVAGDDSDAAPRWAAFELLRDQGRNQEAERVLEELLLLHAVDGRAASTLALLRLEREDHGADTLALAQRGVRFGGYWFRPEAIEVLARVHDQRGEADAAEEARKTAEAMRAAMKLAADHGDQKPVD